MPEANETQKQNTLQKMNMWDTGTKLSNIGRNNFVYMAYLVRTTRINNDLNGNILKQYTVVLCAIKPFSPSRMRQTPQI